LKESKSREKTRKTSKNKINLNKELDPEVATIIDFKCA